VLSTPLPVVHVKLVAVVLAVKFTVPLVQVVFGLADAVTVGKAFTVTSTVVIVELQPVNVFVPVTVYVVLFVGDTVVVLVFAVVLHVYVSAPLADNTTGLPAQVVALDASYYW
jgi:ABC-type microcin C transport system permease subunit YejB